MVKKRKKDKSMTYLTLKMFWDNFKNIWIKKYREMVCLTNRAFSNVMVMITLVGPSMDPHWYPTLAEKEMRSGKLDFSWKRSLPNAAINLYFVA